MSKYKGRIDRHVREAAIALGPYTNSYEVQEYIKARWPRETPEPRTIAALLSAGGYARSTGRLVVLDPTRCRTVAEFEIIEGASA